jgi:hypothetical protein
MAESIPDALIRQEREGGGGTTRTKVREGRSKGAAERRPERYWRREGKCRKKWVR